MQEMKKVQKLKMGQESIWNFMKQIFVELFFNRDFTWFELFLYTRAVHEKQTSLANDKGANKTKKNRV